MADDKPTPKPAAKPQEADEPQRSDDLTESDAEAPGPITPEHESGSWEQTLAEREAQDKAREQAAKKSS